MSYYEKAVLDLLEDGPKQTNWLLGQLCPKVMSKMKYYNTVAELEDAKKISAHPRRVEGRRNWTVWYAIAGQEYLLDVDAARVITAIERLKSVLFRPPTADEVAVETGVTPSEAEKLLYKLGSQAGWFNPSPELIRDAGAKLGEVLVCAARIRDGKVSEAGKSENFDYEGNAEDAGIVEWAGVFLKKHTGLLPRLTDDGLDVVSWPAEAQRFLGGNYKPRSRHVSELFVSRP